MSTKIKKRDLLAGAIGAFGMMLGDLTLSLVKPGVGDGGLFLREGYYNGGYPAWRLVVLFLTGVVGIWGYWHGLRTIEDSFDEECPKTKACFRFCSRIYCFTGLAFHFGIGAGAYFTSLYGGKCGKRRGGCTGDRVYDPYSALLLCGISVHDPYLSDTACYAAAWKDGLFPEDAPLYAGALGGSMRVGSRHPSGARM